MLLPLKWLQNYINLEHTPQEFADIMTKLEFMQDGAIKLAGDQEVIDFEVRQNRPDCLSIIGLAREYCAYINKKVQLPAIYTEIPVAWEQPKNIIAVNAKDIVKRFCAVQIKNIKIGESPEWMVKNLEAYGIPSINNVVDITNYVMLEYGMPLHAFDAKKLAATKAEPHLLTVRKAKNGEKLITWQQTEIELTNKDLIISSRENPVAIAGIIGGFNSGIDSSTDEIILESACYDQASIRKTSIRHNLRTDSSSRHEKFLNPDLVDSAIRRALYLINELCGGEIIKIEDFYENKTAPLGIELNLFEISRIGGVQISPEVAADLLVRLGFEIIEQKDAIGLNQNIVVVKVPTWRTDVQIDADLIEEILRLWGYENIPLIPLKEAPEDYSTYDTIQLEEKVRDILVKLGLDEHITNPLVRYNENNKTQIKLENPLNKDKNALRTTIIETLDAAIVTNSKLNFEQTAVFEIGKIYTKIKEGDYKEKKYISTLYSGHNFANKIKPNFLSVLDNLGINYKSLVWEKEKDQLTYKSGNYTVGTLRHDGYDLLTENLVELIDLKLIPALKIKTTIPQIISEEISFVYDTGTELGDLESAIYRSHDKITKVCVTDTFQNDDLLGTGKTSSTINITFEDDENSLSREDIQQVRNKIIGDAEKLNLTIRA